MLTMYQYGEIRRAFRDGMSIRDIARTFHHSRRTVRQIVAEAQSRPYTRSKPTPAPMLGTFHMVIDVILVGDETAPPKQRHTAMQIYRRLREEHAYQGGYDQVRRYVGRCQNERFLGGRNKNISPLRLLFLGLQHSLQAFLFSTLATFHVRPYFQNRADFWRGFVLNSPRPLTRMDDNAPPRPHAA